MKKKPQIMMPSYIEYGMAKDTYTPSISGTYYFGGKLVYLEAGVTYTMELIAAMADNQKGQKDATEYDLSLFWDNVADSLPGFGLDGVYDGADMPRAGALKSAECEHKWANYVGMFEAYEYCEKCNKKRNS